MVWVPVTEVSGLEVMYVSLTEVPATYPLIGIDRLLQFTGGEILDRCGNDPSAGSPTETLLRLHLPLDDKVQASSRKLVRRQTHNPEISPDHPIGRCDGRCVQRAGT